jgi:hypothetical protein
VGKSARQDGGGERKGEVTAVDLTGDRKAHDVKTCKVYRCAQCMWAGKRF